MVCFVAISEHFAGLGNCQCVDVGCCTANYHQGWPKFVSSLWLASPKDSGLVIY